MKYYQGKSSRYFKARFNVDLLKDGEIRISDFIKAVWIVDVSIMFANELIMEIRDYEYQNGILKINQTMPSQLNKNWSIEISYMSTLSDLRDWKLKQIFN
jgi:hypothetical protein